MRRRWVWCAGVALIAGCGGTTTRTLTVPATPTAPAASGAVRQGLAAGGGEEGIRSHGRLANGSRPSSRPRFAPATGCGIERWAVKTLTDPGASRVHHTPKRTTVAALVGIAPPVDPTDRVAPTETTVWRIEASMTAFKREADSDIHLAVEDAQGHTMIVEFPLTPGCDSTASKADRDAMAKARADFVAACGQPGGRYRTVSGRATITGVGFFDRIHGQRGVAPNGIELHPVTAFAGTCR